MTRLEKAVIDAMMLLEMASERDGNPCYEQFTEEDYLHSAHSVLQFGRGGQHSYDKAPAIMAKISADSAIEDAMHAAGGKVDWIAPEEPKGVFHEGAICFIRQILYDEIQKLGVIHMPELNHSDMRGAIKIFTDIDPEVKQVHTYSAYKIDSIYHKGNDGKWSAARLP